jgi:hypothetical protein
VIEAEGALQEQGVNDREAVPAEREAVLDAFQTSLDRVEDGRAAARREARQARSQAARLRSRARQAREVSGQGRAARAKPRVASSGDRSSLGTEFAVLSDRLLSSTHPQDAIRHVQDAASRLVAGAAVASVVMLSAEGRFFTPQHTDALAERLGQAQYEAGEGPCEDATLPYGPKLARCDDLAAADVPWRRFGPVAVGLGVRSVVAVGMLPLSSSRLGALHLYGRDPGAFETADVDVAVVLASYLAVALVTLTQVDRMQDQLGQLRRALDSRDLIGQAKGVLMGQRNVSADEAFELLSDASQRLNVKLRDIAEQVARNRRL